MQAVAAVAHQVLVIQQVMLALAAQAVAVVAVFQISQRLQIMLLLLVVPIQAVAAVVRQTILLATMQILMEQMAVQELSL
jgi:hypothetical protein